MTPEQKDARKTKIEFGYLTGGIVFVGTMMVLAFAGVL